MIAETLKVVLALDGLKPAPSLPARLDGLFAALAGTPGAAHEIEDEIWALWTGHEDPDAVAQMERAIAAVAAREPGEAELLLDELVATWPDWAEAWNKRATFYFLEGRDEESCADIRRTLRLEPRHFGALAGFGQIALRHAAPAAAVAAFEAALRVNPHLAELRQTVTQLAGRTVPTLH